MTRTVLILATLIIQVVAIQAQANKAYRPGEIRQDLEKAKVLGSVLYLAAHPDDENTRLITYLANERSLNTAYLSLTRGDGGQNLIGPEIRDLLGVIRTYELLAARDLDGGQQFFTRANDFGYSKNPEETFATWDKEKVLADVVWTIRKFRPDVIITRFPPAKYNYQTHGHHSASAILAEEAFEAAGDPTRFPEQLKYVSVWQPKRLYWNTSTWFYKRSGTELDPTGKLVYDIGTYLPELGLSCSELAAMSRSQHKSQGFGSALTRGEQLEYLEYVMGDSAETDIMDGVDLTWNKVPSGNLIEALLNEAIDQFDATAPHKIVPVLVNAYKLLNELPEQHWVDIKKKEIAELIRTCSGFYVEATAVDPFIINGEPMTINLELVDRSGSGFTLMSRKYLSQLSGSTEIPNKSGLAIAKGQKVELTDTIPFPASLAPSAPYWLTKEFVNAPTEEVQSLIGLPGKNMPPLTASIVVKVQDVEIAYDLPIQYKSTDPAKGERYRPVGIVPPYLTIIPRQPQIYNSTSPKTISVGVLAMKAGLNGTVRIIPPGKEWKVSAPQKISLEKKEQIVKLEFTVTPPDGQFTGEMRVQVIDDETGKQYELTYHDLNYDHIPQMRVLEPATFKVVKLDVKKTGEKVGYIMGAGDEIPEALRAIGYDVTILEDADIYADNLKQYDAVLVGIRAFNTRPSLKNLNQELWKYTENGGTVIVQYNTSHRLVTEEVAPYPLTLSRDRITDEFAKMKVLAKKHPVLNTPNVITQADFNDWVQERGLYFPNEWDSAFTPILSGSDPGEEELKGGLLVAKYGKGHYVYTGISWFRELPAGVPGAYRIFANLVSLGNE